VYRSFVETREARSSPAIDGQAASAARSASDGTSPDPITPRSTPPERRCRVRRRVSTSVRAGTFADASHGPSPCSARQFENGSEDERHQRLRHHGVADPVGCHDQGAQGASAPEPACEFPSPSIVARNARAGEPNRSRRRVAPAARVSVMALDDRARPEPVDGAAVGTAALALVGDVDVDPRMPAPDGHLRVGAERGQVGAVEFDGLGAPGCGGIGHGAGPRGVRRAPASAGSARPCRRPRRRTSTAASR